MFVPQVCLCSLSSVILALRDLHPSCLLFTRPQYYTFVNKDPARLHCFYTKKSTLIHGVEGEDSQPCYGQQVRRFFHLFSLPFKFGNGGSCIRQGTQIERQLELTYCLMSCIGHSREDHVPWIRRLQSIRQHRR